MLKKKINSSFIIGNNNKNGRVIFFIIYTFLQGLQKFPFLFYAIVKKKATFWQVILLLLAIGLLSRK